MSTNDNDDDDDTSSILTELPQYSVQNDRQPRPLSPSPSYRTINTVSDKKSGPEGIGRPLSPTPSYRTLDSAPSSSKQRIPPQSRAPAQSLLGSLRPDFRVSRLADACNKGNWDRVLGILANRPKTEFDSGLLEPVLTDAIFCRNSIPRFANNEQYLDKSLVAIIELINTLESVSGKGFNCAYFLVVATKGQGNEDILQRILSNIRPSDKTRALMEVLGNKEQYVAYARLLIEAGADVNHLQLGGQTPLNLVATKWKSAEGANLIQLMHKNGAKLYTGLSWPIEPLASSIKAGNNYVMNVLLNLGVKVDGESMKEACKIDESLVEMLILNDPTAVNACDREKIPILVIFASGAMACSAKTLEILLHRGADVDAKVADDDIARGASQFRTALQCAVETRNIAFVQLLLDYGAKPDCREIYNANTALHLAAMTARSEADGLVAADMISLLLKASADVNAKNYQDRTPLHFAVQYRHGKAAVEALVAGGADVNTQDFEGKSPLVVTRCCTLRRILVEAGADTKRSFAARMKPCVAFVPELPDDMTYSCSPHPHCQRCSSNL